jgi:glutathione peroxidase
MNALAEKFGDKLNILAFPCNQFGHQTNEGNDEFLNTLKHVRPGGGFEPASTVTVFEKGDVNGAEAQPIFKWMKSEIMIPTGGNDESCLVDTMSNGCADADALVLPRGGFGGTTVTLWTPVARSDIAWNFEKFLLDKDGKMVQRYHRYFLVGDIADDIDKLL